MFESSLLAIYDRRQRRQARRRWLSFPVAVALHLVVLASVVFAQYWEVEEVPDPSAITTVFLAERPLPGPPAAPPPPGPRPATPRPAAPAPAPTGAPVQPEVVPDAIPEPPAAPEPGSGYTGLDLILPGWRPGGGGTVEGGGDGPGGEGGPGVAAAPSPSVPIRFGAGITRPEIVHRVEPRYTEAARMARVQGTVILEAVIDEQGRVTEARVLKPLPMGLDRSALDAVVQWRFTPATLGGRPVKIYYSLTIHFKVS